MSVASLVTFMLFLFAMIAPLNLAFDAINSARQALGAYGRIGDVMSLESEPIDEAPGIVLDAIDGGDYALEFQNVVFSYDGSAQSTSVSDVQAGAVLRDLSFRVPRGGRVALVGPSGAGKSTILQLIERFYEIDSGSIRLNGRDIVELPRSVLRSLIGYVEQDAPVLGGTLRSNLLLGAGAATDSELLEALRKVNLLEFVEAHPAGLQMEVGPAGVALSGGERQRLAIARGLLTNPDLLLLDESTSSLDGRNERILQDAIASFARERTLLVVAHRLSTVIDSDLILVIDEGRLVGQGTHECLLRTTPLYRDLAEHQLLA